ncbi:hypothetical protein BGZ96_005567 [Linnemannia gamsii]|uniref:Uncharacterized protein n=1 Tax=Linnemannia gamsii TaxID=64522 RepID=A0ABQ7K5K5_9FUNG|nr:hypothetical protein BGZ96_005567 [Linnemannia gamsii]
MYQPLETWQMTYCYPEFVTDREKFFVLVLSALLHHQQRLTGRNAASILADYGLQLVTQVEFPLFKPFLPTTQDGSSVQQEENKEGPMTVDYSKFMTVLDDYQWQYIEFYRFIRLIEMPTSLREVQEFHHGVDEIAVQATNDSESTEEQGSQSVAAGDDQEGEHTVDLQQNHDYKDLVREGISHMMLHYNFECITEYAFHVSEAVKNLPLASKLASLRHLQVYRDESLPQQHVQDTIAFIHLNKKSFPGKPCLQLGFDYRWSMYDNRVFTSMKEFRSDMFNLTKSKILLYEAVGEPEDLNIGYIPGFYGLAGNISTERLLKLDDEDQFRIDMGEGPEMEAFLKRCHRLNSIKMEVGHPYLLSWAAQHAKDHPSSALLPALDDLYLWSDRPYRFTIHALNDSMAAFSKSLGKVHIINCHEFRTQGQESNPWVLQQDLEKSQMVLTAPLANVIGNWPSPLPQLRSLKIDLRCTLTIQIGSLDQCFNLEELDLRFGSIGGGSQALVPDENDPDTDPRRQAPLDLSLFPKWTLPKLKSLCLDGTPALRFDYDSLETMSNLETLSLSCKKMVGLENQLKDIPRLSLHISHFNSASTSKEQVTAITSTYSTQDPSVLSKDGIWTRTWTLPKLKTLEMEGPPAAVFTFDWLKGCPSLTSVILTLNVHGPPQRLPLIACSPATYALSPSIEEFGSNLSGVESTATATTVVFEDDNGVFKESKLEQLHLKGPWVITASDLTALMTDYAPYLQKLSLNKIQKRDGMAVTTFVQAFKDADEICRKRYGVDWDARPGDIADYEGDVNYEEESDDKNNQDADNSAGSESDPPKDSEAVFLESATTVAAATDNLQAEKPLPGRSLLSVEVNYTISKRHRPTVALEVIDSGDADEYRRRGIRVYNFSSTLLVDKWDKAWFIRNKGTEWWDAMFAEKK